MSTIDRGRRARSSRTAPDGGLRAARAVRVRNACVRHAAERLGLPIPGDEELRALADDVSLRDAVEWWSARAEGVVHEARSTSRGRLALRTGLITAVTVLGLAFSYGRAQ
ncbi:MAG: hypothetical protein KFH98_06650 [Gemmatimonadetes bacterium]|nr:hypothetical protein [Gemmatimonadota bacterium]